MNPALRREGDATLNDSTGPTGAGDNVLVRVRARFRVGLGGLGLGLGLRYG